MGENIASLDRLDRRSYLQATGAAALGTVGLAGCVGRATGTLATHVTDQPADIGDFESLIVTIEGVWLGPDAADRRAIAVGRELPVSPTQYLGRRRYSRRRQRSDGRPTGERPAHIQRGVRGSRGYSYEFHG